VLLKGGAQACNVFWQVGSSASIGSGSSFAGNILALTSITMTTGAHLQGRALARNGAVTLDTNLVTKATCAARPSASDTSATTAAGQPVTLILHGSDANGAALTYTIASGPSHGTLGPIDQGAGTVTYTPDAGYSGPDDFNYQASSTGGTSDSAVGAVTVTPAGGGSGGSGGAGGGGGSGGGGGAGGSGGGAGGSGGGAGGTGGAGAVPGNGAPGTPGAGGILAPGSGVAPVIGSGAPGAQGATSAGMAVRLSGPSQCVDGAFRARVVGRQIARVQFRFAGKLRRTIKARSGQTEFSILLHPTGARSIVRRLTAKVTFKASTGAAPVKLRLVYQRCARAAANPKFTG
jgi:hypothetical protein